MIDSLLDRRVNIGVCPNMREDRRHGSISFQKPDGAVGHYDFLVDHPEYLKKLNEESLDRLFAQVGQLCSTPLTMELSIHGLRRVFQYGNNIPVLVQAVA